jgi:hypothetical protein
MDIDPANPLLCFLFDHEPGYANGMAKAWLRAGELARNTAPLRAKELIRLHRLLGTGGLLGNSSAIHFGRNPATPVGPKFGFQASRDGIERICNDQIWLKERGVYSQLMIDCAAGRAFQKITASPNGVVASLQIAEMARQVDRRELNDAADVFQAVRVRESQFCVFVRWPASKARLEQVMNQILDECEAVCSATDAAVADKEAAIIKAYHRGEFLHAMSDGNCRLWTLAVNTLRMRHGLPIGIFPAPNIADGASTDEAVNAFNSGAEALIAGTPADRSSLGPRRTSDTDQVKRLRDSQLLGLSEAVGEAPPGIDNFGGALVEACSLAALHRNFGTAMVAPGMVRRRIIQDLIDAWGSTAKPTPDWASELSDKIEKAGLTGYDLNRWRADLGLALGEESARVFDGLSPAQQGVIARFLSQEGDEPETTELLLFAAAHVLKIHIDVLEISATTGVAMGFGVGSRSSDSDDRRVAVVAHNDPAASGLRLSPVVPR